MNKSTREVDGRTVSTTHSSWKFLCVTSHCKNALTWTASAVVWDTLRA